MTFAIIVAVASVCVVIVTQILTRRSIGKLRALHGREHEAARRAERTIAERLDLQRAFVHDIGNSLHAIELRAAVMAGVDDIERVRTQCETIRQIVATTSQLLGRFREATAAAKISAAPVDLEDVVQESVSLTGPLARGKDVSLRMAIEGSDAPIAADRERLVQALRFLVEASIQAAPRGSEVVLSVRQEPEAVTFQVRRKGSGLAADELPHVFDLGGGPLLHAAPGSSVGLHVSRSIVEAHGGRIWVESDGGETGAAFCFTLPRSATGATARPV